MSYWTSVHGIIRVDTFALSDPEAMYRAQTVVNHLPKITGSEGCADVYCIKPEGSNCSSTTDEFDQESNLYSDPYYKTFDHQSHIIIVLDGNLRDRMFSDTLREVVKWLSRISSRLGVYSCLVSVQGQHLEEEKYVFHDPQWVMNRDEGEWSKKVFTYKNPLADDDNKDGDDNEKQETESEMDPSTRT